MSECREGWWCQGMECDDDCVNRQAYLADQLCECGYDPSSFACKIRHIHVDTTWAKGDH